MSTDRSPSPEEVREIREADQPFRTLVERMQEGVLTLSVDGTILYANAFFAGLLGVPVKDVIGAPLSRFIPAGDRPTIEALVRKGIAGTAKVPCRLEATEGTIPARLTLSPFAGGSRPSCCAVVFDLRAPLDPLLADKNADENVALPRARDDASDVQEDPPSGVQPRGELQGLSALIVDDDEDSLELVEYLLDAAGCRVTTADSAEKALAALTEGDFGLLVSDIGLPDQDGLELMREIRARGFDARHLPAIALTGYAGVHDARLVGDAGYQKHLAKPLDIPSLLAAAIELGRKTAA